MFVSGTHCPGPNLAVRARNRFGLRGQRIGEADNPGPVSTRRAWDSDTESVDESRNVVRRLDCQGTVVDVDTDDDELPLVRFCPPTEVVEGLERDLKVRDSQMDQSSGGCDARGAVGFLHVLATRVAGRPDLSNVDCVREAEFLERRCGSKRLRLQFPGSQATTVPASWLHVHPHFESFAAGGGARVEDSSTLRVAVLADESQMVETVVEEFSHRPCIMKSVPKFFIGPYRSSEVLK